MALFKSKKQDEEKKIKEEEKPVEKQEALPSAPSLPKGGDAHSYSVVLSPHITEKGTLLSEQNHYIFKVAKDAGKTEIKRAVANLYGVEVDKVRVLHMPFKERRVGRFQGHKSGFKKAIVTLKEGSKIDIAA